MNTFILHINQWVIKWHCREIHIHLSHQIIQPQVSRVVSSDWVRILESVCEEVQQQVN